MDFLENQEQSQLERIAKAIEAEALTQGFTEPVCTVVVHGDRRAIRFTSVDNPHVDRDRGADRALWLWASQVTGRWVWTVEDIEEGFHTAYSADDGQFNNGLPAFSELLKGWAP